MADEYEEFRKYIGRKTVTEDVVSAAQVRKMMVTLNRDDAPPQPGDPLPLRMYAGLDRPGTRVKT